MKRKFSSHLVSSFIAFAISMPAPAGALRSKATDTIPLHYQQGLMKLGFPSPLLQATVSGQQVWFIIDTGAGVHTFASWFVSAAGIGSRQTNGSVTGSTGATESRLTKAEGTTLQLDDDRKLTLREAIVVDLPSIFAEQRIAGLLSPQLLAAPHTAAVLDLRVPRLRFEPFGTAVGSLGRKHVMILTGVRACRNAQSPFANRQYAAVIKVDGIDGTMLVDSGATGTVAFPESQIASKLASRASETNRTQGVGGTVQTTRKVHSVRLERGGTAATSDLIIGGAAGSCGSDGLLGMDALRQCVLVLGDRFAWFCDATSK